MGRDPMTEFSWWDGSSAGWPVGWNVRWVAETESTNADLITAGCAGARDRTVLFADFQTAGRGRLDRRWEAPAGANLLASILLRTLVEHPHVVTQRIALAATAAIERVAGMRATIKWPNDILVDDAKLAGVLAQTATSPAGPFVVVGIGLNVGWAPAGAACLGPAADRREILRAMLEAFDLLPSDVTEMYRSKLSTVGRPVRVDLIGDRFVEGIAVGVEPDGRLLVLDDCAITHRIDSGDVVHLRPTT